MRLLTGNDLIASEHAPALETRKDPKVKKTLAVLVLVICAMPAVLIAQKKPATQPRRRTTAPAPTPTPNLKAAATQVADQLKIVTRFVYLYGKIANGLEIAEEKTKREAAGAIVANIAGLKTGINKVAMELKADDRLQVHYLKLTTATDAISNAEQLAAAGRFDEAGKALVVAVEKLADWLNEAR